MAVECKNCGGAHPLWECTKPSKKSQAHDPKPVFAFFSSEPKQKRGRPKTDFNKEEYNRIYMRDLRTIKRLGLSVTVKQYRESLK